MEEEAHRHERVERADVPGLASEQQWPQGSRAGASDYESIKRDVCTYVAGILAQMASPPDRRIVCPHRDGDLALANEIFSVLTSRAFCYLGRINAERYRKEVVASLERRISAWAPFRFFYDIGPGYHATTRPGVSPIRYDIGLSELLILSQLNALHRRISELYSPGARFFLVIDNLCGLRTNDVPLECTESYAKGLRRLIEALRMSDSVELIVESEQFDLEEYDHILANVSSQPLTAPPSQADIDNVARFLGRPCTAVEAAERMERYRRTSLVTNQLLDRLVQDVHMTQRATGATLGFRPFPGGDQRTQVGEVVLARNPRGRLHPRLLTSRNVHEYECIRVELADVLPAPMTYVTFALPLPASDAAAR